MIKADVAKNQDEVLKSCCLLRCARVWASALRRLYSHLLRRGVYGTALHHLHGHEHLASGYVKRDEYMSNECWVQEQDGRLTCRTGSSTRTGI